MCKIISSEAVIGNFILASVEKDTFNISIEKMISYDENLSKKLKPLDYYTKFDFDEILSFKDNYPYFVEEVKGEYIKVFCITEDKNRLINQLKRYFRMGMPTIVVNEMVSVSQSILDLG